MATRHANEPMEVAPHHQGGAEISMIWYQGDAEISMIWYQGDADENCRALTHTPGTYTHPKHLHTHQALTHISSDQNVKAEMERTPPVVRMQSSWSSHWSWWRRQSVQPLWRMVCQILVKLHIHLLLGNIPTRNEHLCAPKDLCENTHGSFTPNSQQLEENG